MRLVFENWRTRYVIYTRTSAKQVKYFASCCDLRSVSFYRSCDGDIWTVDARGSQENMKRFESMMQKHSIEYETMYPVYPNEEWA